MGEFAWGRSYIKGATPSSLTTNILYFWTFTANMFPPIFIVYSVEQFVCLICPVCHVDDGGDVILEKCFTKGLEYI